MRLENKAFSFVVNFLLGVAWAAVLLGAITSFLSFYQDSFLAACVSALMGMIPGMVAVILIEHIMTHKEKLLELKKQTSLLEALLENKS